MYYYTKLISVYNICLNTDHTDRIDCIDRRETMKQNPRDFFMTQGRFPLCAVSIYHVLGTLYDDVCASFASVGLTPPTKERIRRGFSALLDTSGYIAPEVRYEMWNKLQAELNSWFGEVEQLTEEEPAWNARILELIGGRRRPEDGSIANVSHAFTVDQMNADDGPGVWPSSGKQAWNDWFDAVEKMTLIGG